MRPNHLHLMVEAPGFRKLVTAFYPEGDAYIESDAVFGVKKSLVVVSFGGTTLRSRTYLGRTSDTGNSQG